MSLNDYKNETMQLIKTKQWDGISIETLWLLLSEEFGELAGALRRYRHCFLDRKITKVESELGDVFSYLFQLAEMLNIDMDTMWKNQQEKMSKKRYYTNNRGRYW